MDDEVLGAVISGRNLDPERVERYIADRPLVRWPRGMAAHRTRTILLPPFPHSGMASLHISASPLLSLVLVPGLILAGCDDRDAPEPATDAPERVTALGPSPEQEVFWENLKELCGQAFRGEPREAPEDSDWWEADLVMHVRVCGDDEIRVPLHVDDDRSRTWVVTRTDAGLRLKHDHRLEDGTPDPTNTDYGGDTTEPGSETRQEFPADAYSIEAVPGRATQHWFLEVHPEEIFAYGLVREENGLRYRVEFDLNEPVETPPAPWGTDAGDGGPE